MCCVVTTRNGTFLRCGALLLTAVVSVFALQPSVCGADDIHGVKTFSSVGKGQPVLNGYKEAELLRTEGLTLEELNRAKAKVVGQRKIARQDLGSFAMIAALDELYGLGYDHSDKDDALFEAGAGVGGLDVGRVHPVRDDDQRVVDGG